jgi:hypothetical protein
LLELDRASHTDGAYRLGERIHSLDERPVTNQFFVFDGGLDESVGSAARTEALGPSG